MNRTEYEGFTNSETHTIAMDITNTQTHLAIWLLITKELGYDKLRVADKLQHDYESFIGDDPDDIKTILANEALGEVDWYDIAEHLITIAKEQDEYRFRQAGEKE